jgi:hypothetical protein
MAIPGLLLGDRRDLIPGDRRDLLPGDRLHLIPGDRAEVGPGDRLHLIPGDRRDVLKLESWLCGFGSKDIAANIDDSFLPSHRLTVSPSHRLTLFSCFRVFTVFGYDLWTVGRLDRWTVGPLALRFNPTAFQSYCIFWLWVPSNFFRRSRVAQIAVLEIFLFFFL